MSTEKKDYKKQIFCAFNAFVLMLFILMLAKDIPQITVGHAILLGIIYFGIGYYFNKKTVLKVWIRFKREDKKNRILTLLFTSATTIIIGGIYIPQMILDELYVEDNIIIKAVGQKGQDSLGTEVWITNIQDIEGNADISEITKVGEWEYRETSLLSFQNQPSEIHISLAQHKEPISIEFLKHNYSGKVEISNNTQTEIVDLYSEGGDMEQYELSTKGYEINQLGIIKSCLMLYIMFTLIIVGVQVYFEKLRDKGTINVK